MIGKRRRRKRERKITEVIAIVTAWARDTNGVWWVPGSGTEARVRQWAEAFVDGLPIE